MATDFSWQRLLREPVANTLKSMCCDPLQFMWDNHLLAARDEWDCAEDVAGHIVRARALLGFRVVRKFMFLDRDQVLHRCPFRAVELIAVLGMASDGPCLGIRLEGLKKGYPVLHIPKSEMQRHLEETIRHNRAGWPPKN